MNSWNKVAIPYQFIFLTWPQSKCLILYQMDPNENENAHN